MHRSWSAGSTAAALVGAVALALCLPAPAAVAATPDAATPNAVVPAESTTPPSPPSALAATAAGSTLDISWTVPEVPVGGYDVYCRLADGGTLVYEASLPSSATAVTVTGLAPLTTYEVQVVAFNGAGRSDASTLTVTTPRLLATTTTPSSPTATAVTLTVAWQPTLGPDLVTPTGYTVAYKPVTATAWSTVATTSTTVTLVGLTPETAYQFKVRSTAGSEASLWSVMSVASTAAGAAPPVALKAQLVTTTSLTVSWWSGPGGGIPDGHTIRYRTAGTAGWTTLAVSSDQIADLNGLSPHTTYEIQVRASSGGTTSDWSVAMFATTAGQTTATERYVTSVYDALFHRAPDAAGLATWTTLLDQGTPRGAVADAITASAEYRSRLIAGVYRDYLGRAPDAVGLASWLSQMNRGMTLEQMGAGFVASEEFYRKAGATPGGWVTRLYQTVLHRNPAPSEVSYWVGRLAHGASRGSVAMGFLLSTEHLSSVVDGYYVTILGRHLDPSGKGAWVSAIQRGALDEQVVAEIVSSAEYWSKNT